MSNQFIPLTKLPLQPGDQITSMCTWEALGKQCIMIATQRSVYCLRLDSDGLASFAGPLEFEVVPK